MSASDFAREPLQAVEIIQPLCSRTFGVAPCLAAGDECWNTAATCKFLTALDLTDEVVMRFVAPGANRYIDSATAFQPGEAIGSLMSASTAPTVLNVAAGNDDISPLGLRAVAEVVIRDHPYNDVGYDPYLSSRSYDPMTLGSFWTKWLARNPYHTGYTVNIYDGYFGDALADMIKREYAIEKIDASRSSVRITAKDILRRITDTRVTAPTLSNGALSLDLAIGGTSFQAAGGALADYPATGWVRINQEVIAYTSRATVGSNVEFTGLTRGALNTTASAHTQLDRVQRVLSYVDEPFQDIIYDLLTVWGGIPTSYITKADWDDEKLEWRDLYNFTGYLTDVEEVQKLVGEICQQAQANIWWDERVQKIILRAQRPNFQPSPLTQDGHIVSDSVTIEEIAKDRASQVYVYYGLRNPTLAITDKFSYRAAAAFIDADSEVLYGEPAVKELFCRWISTSVIAQSLGGSYSRRFKDVRRHITFDLTAKDIASFWTGDVAQIEHFMYVDATGAPLVQQWLITSAETKEHGGIYSFVAEDNGSAGVLWEWVDGSEMRPSTEIGAWVDADGTDGAGNTLPFGWI